MNNQENLEDFNLTDFVWNDEFRKWVLSPNDDSDFFWKNWLIENPEKERLILAAKKIVSSITISELELSEEEIAYEVQNIIAEINREEMKTSAKAGWLVILNNRYWQLGLSAAIIIMVAVSAAIWYARQPGEATITYQELVKSADEKLIEKVNESEVSLEVILPDGSKVTLQKKSKISYSTTFNSLPKRKLFLSGTALFEVVKNEGKPFFVYTNGLITKVLGTRFIVHSSDTDRKVSVEVISGIVSVYSYIDKRSNDEASSKKINTLILTANQKANYSGEDKTLIATIVTNPVVLYSQEVDFKFENTLIDSVFKSIEKAYGIDIIYDEKSIAKRTFTATLTTESMYEKMEIICKAINARYEVIDGKIAVYNNVSNQ